MRTLGVEPLNRVTMLALGCAAALWLLLARATPAQAAGVVTNCTNDTQLRTMLTAGGSVSFNCNNNHSPATIVVNPAISLGAGDFSLDGGGKVTLSGGSLNRIFIVSGDIFASPSFTLSHIVLTNGYADPALGTHGGCVYIGYALTVLLDDVTVQNCRTENGGAGGAIRNGLGGLTLRNSRVLTNTAGRGGGITSATALTLANTLVAANRAITGTGGGIDVVLGQAVISGSTIYSNTAAQNGGGVFAGSPSDVSVTNSQVQRNTTTMGRGGGLYSNGSLTVRQTSLTGNRALHLNGGGIYNAGGMLSLFTSMLTDNYSDFEGGGIYNYFGTIGLSNVTLNGNSAAGYGGGLFNENSTAVLTNVTLSGNSAVYGGGGLYNYYSTAVFTNATLSGNSADAGGGLYNFNGIANLLNVTFSANAAPNGGGGIYHYGGAVANTTTLKNSIVANSVSGGNCEKASSSMGAFISNNFNLSDDNTCAPFFIQSSDLNGADKDPHLGSLANNGGATLTHVPLPPSPAIDAGQCSIGSLDQRGVIRPQGTACDIGAVEYVAGQAVPWLWLPFIRR